MRKYGLTAGCGGGKNAETTRFYASHTHESTRNWIRSHRSYSAVSFCLPWSKERMQSRGKRDSRQEATLNSKLLSDIAALLHYEWWKLCRSPRGKTTDGLFGWHHQQQRTLDQLSHTFTYQKLCLLCIQHLTPPPASYTRFHFTVTLTPPPPTILNHRLSPSSATQQLLLIHISPQFSQNTNSVQSCG
jgi:hypothetical protein